MTNKQSRRTQRALERALFGPGPAQLRPIKPTVRVQVELPKYQPGNCGACGNTCSAVDHWTCPGCGVTFPGVVDGQVAVSLAHGVKIHN